MTPDQIAKVLGQPITLNKVTLANRIVMAPMAAHSAAPDGNPSEETIAFFESRARGGVGMIIVGGMAASPSDMDQEAKAGGTMLGALRIDDDRFVPGLKRMNDTVHGHKVPIVAEIAAGLGRMARTKPLVSASAGNVTIPKDQLPAGIHAPNDVVTEMASEISVEKIKLYEREIAEAAERAQRAGFDGVEVAAHMSYLLASFLSPRSNSRTDEYGGSIENRARMLVNIFTGIRERVGPDYLVGLRIISNEYHPEGMGAEGYAAIAKIVVDAGADYVAMAPANYERMHINMSSRDGWLIDNGDARLFKETLPVPVLVQGIHDPNRIAEVISGGEGDLIMLGRPLLADPEFARKLLDGRLDAIVRCVRDNYCMRRFIFGMPIRCEVNPKLGVESRKGGPSLERMAKVPVEQTILALTGSKALMDFVGVLTKKRG